MAQQQALLKMNVLPSQQFIGMDMTDLTRGQGEWKNMQDVVRRAFTTVFGHMSQQQDQIKQLNEVQ